jgi:hypothetical protein
VVDLHGEAARVLPESGARLVLHFRGESLQPLDRGG